MDMLCVCVCIYVLCGSFIMCNKNLVKMARSREKIDFMLNELEFIHLSIILYIMLKYIGIEPTLAAWYGMAWHGRS